MSIHPDKKAAVVALHAEGRGRNAIARELGISTRQVDNVATENGLTWLCDRTDEAALARRSSAARDRAELADRARQLAHDVLGRAEQAEDVLELRRLVLVARDLVAVDSGLNDLVPSVSLDELDPEQAGEWAALSRERQRKAEKELNILLGW